MLNKALICIVMLAFVFGCANQQKDTEEKPAEETQQTETTEQAQETETTEQAEEAAVAIEEISLTVTGMT
jgi:flagellar biosynthesis component FlhA